MTKVTRMAFMARITVPVNERAIVLKAGRFVDILRPGRHVVCGRTSTLEVVACNLLRPEFVSDYDHALFRERPDLAAEHLLEVRTDPDEVAVVFRDGRPYTVVAPEGRAVYFVEAGPFAVERHDVADAPEVPERLAVNTEFVKRNAGAIHRFVVGPGQAGLLFVDNALKRELAPGVHTYFNAGRATTVRTVDLRTSTVEVNGQEILTKDRVTLRVNLVARYRVADAVKAVTEVADFAETLYTGLQLAFRKSLGTKTLDEILANKGSVDAEAAEEVRGAMAGIGIEVGEISLKDVILPGEMRDILNRVVQAEKEAQANVIRRREETAATRSLLNTAKVMAENPVMLRLKELEALEQISGKVQYLAVHNGTQGLLQDLVNLRETPKN
jgi:regulator of protease activity HflC (stomatin/prohibitin superfamily)